MRRKHIIGAYKLKNFLINGCICMLLAIVSIVAFLGEGETTEVSASESAIYYGNKEKNNVSLMFNVYWGTEYIEPILDVLKEYDAKVTFFVGGMWVLDNENLVKKIQAEGHELANHGYKHKSQDSLSYDESRKEIETTDKLIFDATGIKMELFAPPSGAYNAQTIKVAQELGYKTIMWTRDTIDWRDHDSNLIYKRAINKLSNGDLILMHPTEATLEALPNILKTINEKDFNVKKVSECLA